MKKLFNLPTLVIIGLLSIYYISIFLNLQSILKSLLGTLPLFLGYFIWTFLVLIPIGIKGGLLMYRGKRKSLKKILYFSGIVLVIFGMLVLLNTDIGQLWKNILSSNLLKQYHRNVFGLISIITLYLFFFLLIEAIRLETFMESVKSLPIVSPVFCFGAPAFWTEKLKSLNLNISDIYFLSSVSFFCGVIFLISLLIYFVGKNYNDDVSHFSKDAVLKKKELFIKTSIGLIFLGISILLFVCIDISFLIAAM